MHNVCIMCMYIYSEVLTHDMYICAVFISMVFVMLYCVKSFSCFTKASWITIPRQPSHSTYPTLACIESVKHRNRNRHYSCYGNCFYGNHFFSDTSCVYTCDMLSPHLSLCAYVCRSRSTRGIRSSYVTG